MSMNSLDVIDMLVLRRIEALDGEASASLLSEDMLCHKRRVQGWLNRLAHIGLLEDDGLVYSFTEMGLDVINGSNKEEEVHCVRRQKEGKINATGRSMQLDDQEWQILNLLAKRFNCTTNQALELSVRILGETVLDSPELFIVVQDTLECIQQLKKRPFGALKTALRMVAKQDYENSKKDEAKHGE